MSVSRTHPRPALVPELGLSVLLPFQTKER